MRFLLTLFTVFLAASSLQTRSASAMNISDAEYNFYVLLNQYRQQNGLAPLALSPILYASATWMSHDMSHTDNIDHTDSTGRSAFARIESFGFPANSYMGENILGGYETSDEAFNAFRTACDADASGACTYAHNQNMLDPHYTKVGISKVVNMSGAMHWYWTTDFGGGD